MRRIRDSFSAALFIVVSLIFLVSCSSEVAMVEKVPSEDMTDITPEESYYLILQNRDNDNFIIMDVRTLEEFRQERLAGSINVDFYMADFKAEIDALDENKEYLVYCRTGRRSEYAVELMLERGIRSSYNMLEGIEGWKRQGYTTIKD